MPDTAPCQACLWCCTAKQQLPGVLWCKSTDPNPSQPPEECDDESTGGDSGDSQVRSNRS
eukprot:1157613-Pelagomonas_calceolata.AAC.5